MKATTFFIVFFAIGLFATETHSQVSKVNLNVVDMSVKEVLREIEKQTDYLFIFNPNEINVNKKTSLRINDKMVSEVLSDLFRKTDVIYAMEGNNIMLMKQSEVLQQSKKQITGIIMDEQGDVIIGANVIEKGNQNGVITDVDGKFSITLSADNVLQVSYIGYVTQEVAVKNQTNLRIILKEDLQFLDEVVVGYGTMRKADLTGAVATVDSKVLEDRPITNLGSGLQGVIANLNISSPNGAPGTGASFNIRGTTNLSGGSPLILVDGIEMDPNLINPQDVKDVTVLKDAASASIYGARAAFGVILITTKTGFVTQKPLVSFSANYSINVPTVHAKYMNSM